MKKRLAGLAAALVGGALMLGFSPAQPVCTYSVTPTMLEFDGEARTGVIQIDTQPGCAWTAEVTDSWIGIGASAGSGPTALAFSVAHYAGGINTDPFRQAGILVRWNTPTAGQNVWITQTLGPCRAAMFPEDHTFGPRPGSGAILTFPQETAAPWRLLAASDWIHPARPLGIVATGVAQTTFVVDANTEVSPRDGFITPCSGQSIRVHQAGRSLRSGAYVPADVDDDGAADLVVYRRTEGTWFALRSTTAFTHSTVLRGGVIYPANYPPFVVPVAGDFDGDNKLDQVNYDRSFNARYSSNGYAKTTAKQVIFPDDWTQEDRPVLADFNGDGKSDFAIYRPATGEWLVRVSDALTPARVPDRSQWGLPGDIPVPADYDGDGLTDLAVWRPSNGAWYLRLSSTGYNAQLPLVVQWGLPGDVPTPGDFDGDGRADLAVWRPSNGVWYVVFASSNYAASVNFTVQWGLAGDVPVANDYDGDGRMDFAVWRPTTGTWFLLTSTGRYQYANARAYQWGLPGDIPVIPR